MIRALIFDMDGTMIDSMPSHQRSWVAFTRRLGLEIDVADLMRRTTGRTGVECMRELFGDISAEQAQVHVDEKEAVFRELFAPIFSEVPGFKAFLALGQPLRAVGICSSHAADQLGGPHVLARVPDYHALITSRFLENHHVLAA